MGGLLRVAVLAVALGWLVTPGASAYVDLAGNSAGDQVLVHQVLGQHNRPLFAGVRPAGGAFSSFVPLTGPVDPVERAMVIDDAGGAVVAWVTNEVAYEPPTGHVMVEIRQPRGDFEQAVQLAPNAHYLQLFGNGRGDVLATWYPPDGPRQYSVRPAGGEFAPSQTFPRPLVGVAMDGDGTVKGVFTEFTYPGDRLLEGERPPGGDFGALREIPGAEHASGEHLAAAPDGRALLVSDSGQSRMAADRLPGGDFGTPVEVQKLGRYGPTADVKLSSSGAAAISSGTGGGQIAIRTPGGQFSSSRQVGGVRGGELASLAVNVRGDVALTWHGYGGGVRAAYRDADAGAWSKPITIARAPGFVAPIYAPPGLALADPGEATVAWEESDGATVRTYARAFQGRDLTRTQLVDSIPAYFAEGPPAACRPKAGRMMLASPSATVFSKPDFGFNEVFGCFLRRGAPIPLVDRPSGFAAHTMSLVGPLVAYGSDDLDETGTTSYVNVVDLRDFEYGITRAAVMEPNFDTAILLATRLRRNGAVAWISCPDDSETRVLAKPCRRLGGEKKHLWALGSRADEPRLLDSSRSLDRRTLKLHGSLLTWRHGRRLRRARLR